MPTGLCNLACARKGDPSVSFRIVAAAKLLRQIDDFTFYPDALSSDKAITLFDRGAPIPWGSLDDLWEIPF
jgi:hypothetical protein